MACVNHVREERVRQHMARSLARRVLDGIDCLSSSKCRTFNQKPNVAQIQREGDWW